MEWFTLVAAVVAAGVSIWNAAKNRELSNKLAKADRFTTLLPPRLDKYKQFLKVLAGVDRNLGGVDRDRSLPREEGIREWVDDAFLAMANDATARWGEAKSLSIEIGILGTEPVVEASRRALATMEGLRNAWMGVLLEYMKMEDGDPSAAIESRVAPAQEAVKAAAAEFEAAVRIEQQTN